MAEDAPFRRAFDAARDPLTARNALGITGTGGSGSGFITAVTPPLQVTGTTLSIDLSAYSTTAQIAAAYQPLDADLTAIAALTGTNTIYYRSAANTWSPVTIGTGLSFTSGTLAASASGSGLTTQVFTSGSGTYTTPPGVTRIEIEMIGGGGGGRGGGTTPGTGTAGNNTTWGGTLLVAGGGAAPTNNSDGGAGGTVSGTGTRYYSVAGGAGGGAVAVDTTASASGTGGQGGNGYFGGAGAGVYSAAGSAAVANSGGGGGGGATLYTINAAGGGGGGAGGYLRALINSPAASYAYVVGSGGGGGGPGGNGYSGAAGGSGVIIVREYYGADTSIGIGAAPIGAEYITSTADAILTAERVLTDTATVTWDRTTAGQIKANVVSSGGGIGPPQGRLTLQSLTSVMTATVSGATTIFYTPYVGNQIPIFDGTSMVMTTFTELTVATTDTTKSPAAIGASKVNDWFVWNDAGTIRLGHGRDWVNDTTRLDAIVRVNGIWTNASNTTNGAAAQRGTYVGTTRSNAASMLDWIFGGLAVGGTAGFFGLWNCYNRVEVASITGETTDTWTYSTAIIRPVNASSAMRCSFVRGLNEDPATAEYGGQAASGSAYFSVGIGLNSTTAMTGLPGTGVGGSLYSTCYGKYSALPGIGFNFLQALEYSSGGTANFFGDNGSPGTFQNGLLVRIKA